MADVEAEHSDRTGPGPRGSFSKKGEAACRQKLPAIRAWLIDVARRGETVTYGEVMERFAVDRFSLRHAMDSLGQSRSPAASIDGIKEIMEMLRKKHHKHNSELNAM